jgi:hypothetical protein
VIGAKVIQLDRLVRRYGPEAEGIRELVGPYTAMSLRSFILDIAALDPCFSPATNLERKQVSPSSEVIVPLFAQNDWARLGSHSLL